MTSHFSPGKPQHPQYQEPLTEMACKEQLNYDFFPLSLHCKRPESILFQKGDFPPSFSLHRKLLSLGLKSHTDYKYTIIE